jgi:hypothetical protein
MRIKIFAIPHGLPQSTFQHEVISVAEGLRDLGIEYHGNADYWLEPERNAYLITEAPAGFDADVHVYGSSYLNKFPAEFSKIDYNKINVFIDREDGLYGEYCNPAYSRFDLILRTHYNKKIKYSAYHPNIQPWAFGLSKRIMNAVDASARAEAKEQVCMNFRISHDLRKMAVEKLNPLLEKRFAIINEITNNFGEAKAEKMDAVNKHYYIETGFRHDPDYFRLLNSSLLTYAFGGFIFLKPFASNRIEKQLQLFTKLKLTILNAMGADISSCYMIDQYDSWRLWEAFYSNTCPIHMDFGDWGWKLPVMPKSKVHYLGVKGFDFARSAEELLSLHKDDIKQIGHNGREWSKEHYSPAAVASRLLKLISQIKK